MSMTFYSRKILVPLLRIVPLVVIILYFISLPITTNLVSIVAYIACIELVLVLGTLVLYLDSGERKFIINKLKSVLKHN